MQVVKNIKSGRLFEWNPLLAKDKHIVEASAEEAAQFISDLSEGDRILIESRKDAYLDAIRLKDIAPDFDPETNIETMGKPQLLGLAKQIPGLVINPNTGVTALRTLMQSVLDYLKEALKDRA